MSNQKTSVIRFLNELNSIKVKETFDGLTSILAALENKNDPDRAEMEIVESVYQFIEKLNIMDNNLRQYVKGLNEKSLPSNILTELYSNIDD
jgi:hypothetical protein